MCALLFAAIVSVGLSSPQQTTTTSTQPQPAVPYDAMGEKCGEVTPTSAILHTRLTAWAVGPIGQAIPGAPGRVRFEYSTDPQLATSSMTQWQSVKPEDDFTAKARLADLKPDTKYYYRIRIGDMEGQQERVGPVRQFKTAPPEDALAPVRFASITGQCFEHRDSDEGFFSYRQMLKAGVDFIVPTGDNVYYDRPREDISVEKARLYWHCMYSLPIAVDFYSQVPGYWEKDDHDYRFDDADPYRRANFLTLSHEEGIKIFLEQHPVEQPTYRTYRWGRGLQIWMVEGRDFRSRNTLPDGPDKTIWGPEQKAWLQRTILASPALFKVLISPTPLVGPDNARKRDNHVNPEGFRHEGTAFFDWLKANDVKNFFIVCGDRHWRYHSIHPSGYHEFCTGALSDKHMLTYDPEKLDGLIPGTNVVWGNDKLIGGFLLVRVEPGESAEKGRIVFAHMTWQGDVEHRVAFEYAR